MGRGVSRGLGSTSRRDVCSFCDGKGWMEDAALLSIGIGSLTVSIDGNFKAESGRGTQGTSVRRSRSELTKPTRVVSWAGARGRLRAWSRSIALPSFFASPDPSLLVTSVVWRRSFLARARGACRRGRRGSVVVGLGVSDAAKVSCACCRKRVSRPRSGLGVSRFPRRVFLLRSRRCLRFGARSGPSMEWRESGHLLPAVPAGLYWHRFQH